MPPPAAPGHQLGLVRGPWEAQRGRAVRGLAGGRPEGGEPQAQDKGLRPPGGKARHLPEHTCKGLKGQMFYTDSAGFKLLELLK